MSSFVYNGPLRGPWRSPPGGGGPQDTLTMTAGTGPAEQTGLAGKTANATDLTGWLSR
jgi:hypothetical protein